MIAKKLSVSGVSLTVACVTILVLTAAPFMPTIQSAEADWSTVTAIGSYGPDGPYIDVAQFNPTLGTLQEAIFTLTENLTGTFSCTNNSSAGQYAYWGLIDNLSISYGNMSVSETVSSGYDANFNTANMNKAGPIASGQTITVSTINMNNSSQMFTFTDPGQLSAFLGKGTLPFNLVSNQSDESVVTGGNYSSGFSTQASGTVSVQYEYTAAPIPGTILLFVPCFVCLAAMRAISRHASASTAFMTSRARFQG